MNWLRHYSADIEQDGEIYKVTLYDKAGREIGEPHWMGPNGIDRFLREAKKVDPNFEHTMTAK